jgi:tRNA modification GTPase
VTARHDVTNRALLLTAPGAAAIAVIRLTGPNVRPFLATHFSKPPAPGKTIHGELRDGADVIDDPVVVLIRDDLADLSLHGGPWVVKRALELTQRSGFTTNDGDTLPDATDPLEAEVEQSLPFARTELAVRALLAQPAAWKNLNPATAAGMLEDRALYHLLNPPRVAIVGPPNVGKSTLANQLFGQERSIVADLPGTTRDWVGELATINGLPVTLIDTPGLRQTPDPIEREAISRSSTVIQQAGLIIVVLDATIPLADQQPLLTAHPAALIVINKSDRADLPIQGIRTVATTGRGVEDLRHAICRHFGCDRLDLTKPRWWTERQRTLLSRMQPPRA